MKPLENLLVVDFSQFLSGPSASLRLADLGARVIKIERPAVGDLCRQLYISNLSLDGDSTLFHSINRNKESFAADLKNPRDLAALRELLRRADVMIQNFRPWVIERAGLGYDAVHELNPRIVYGEVTGYGTSGPWVNKPGQDLLVQSLSGLPYLNGDAAQPPVPFGLAVADILAGAHLVQGILAALVRRGSSGQGARVEVSLLESVLDLQFEVLTTYLNDGGKAPIRSGVNNAHAYLGAPYGIYATSDGYIALAMGSIVRLGELLDCPALTTYNNPALLFDERDEIKSLLVHHLRQQTTSHWLGILEPADVWCSDVLTWDRLFQHAGFTALNMIQTVSRPGDGNLAAGASLFYHAEFQVHYALEMIHETLSSGARWSEVQPDAHDEYVARYTSEIGQMVWSHHSIRHSHYKNSQGKVFTLSPWPLDLYWEWTRKVARADYAFG